VNAVRGVSPVRGRVWKGMRTSVQASGSTEQAAWAGATRPTSPDLNLLSLIDGRRTPVPQSISNKNVNDLLLNKDMLLPSFQREVAIADGRENGLWVIDHLKVAAHIYRRVVLVIPGDPTIEGPLDVLQLCNRRWHSSQVWLLLTVYSMQVEEGW
jgi:hypothetical protein